MENSRVTVRTTAGETNNFEVNRGVRQGDALSATLFIIALEKVIRNTGCTGTIINKENQVIAYADDLVIVSRSKEGLINVFRNIKREANGIGLSISQTKTKYMKCTREKNDSRPDLIIDEDVFQCVQDFNYLGVPINYKNNRNAEVKAKIQAGNRAYYANKHLLRDRQITKRSKMKIYKSLIRPVITYAAEVLCMTRGEENEFRVFERKVLRAILGFKRVNGENRIRYQTMKF